MLATSAERSGGTRQRLCCIRASGFIRNSQQSVSSRFKVMIVFVFVLFLFLCFTNIFKYKLAAFSVLIIIFNVQLRASWSLIETKQRWW